MGPTRKELTVITARRGDWITAEVECDGSLLASETAPVVEGAIFDMEAAVVRAAVERALQERHANYD